MHLNYQIRQTGQLRPAIIPAIFNQIVYSGVRNIGHQSFLFLLTHNKKISNADPRAARDDPVFEIRSLGSFCLGQIGLTLVRNFDQVEANRVK